MGPRKHQTPQVNELMNRDTSDGQPPRANPLCGGHHTSLVPNRSLGRRKQGTGLRRRSESRSAPRPWPAQLGPLPGQWRSPQRRSPCTHTGHNQRPETCLPGHADYRPDSSQLCLPPTESNNHTASNGMDPFPMGLTNFKKVSLVGVTTDEFVG